MVSGGDGGSDQGVVEHEQIADMSDGDFYHYMLDKDHYEWAKWANIKGDLGLDHDGEACLATWFASAQMAVVDREQARYIRARLDAEKAEDGAAE